MFPFVVFVLFICYICLFLFHTIRDTCVLSVCCSKSLYPCLRLVTRPKPLFANKVPMDNRLCTYPVVFTVPKRALDHSAKTYYNNNIMNYDVQGWFF